MLAPFMALVLGLSVAGAKPDAGTNPAEDDDIPAADTPDQFGVDTDIEHHGGLPDPGAEIIRTAPVPEDGESGASGDGYYGEAVDEDAIDTAPSDDPAEASVPDGLDAVAAERAPAEVPTEAATPSKPSRRADAPSPPAKAPPPTSESGGSDTGSWIKIVAVAAFAIGWVIFLLRRRRAKR